MARRRVVFSHRRNPILLRLLLLSFTTTVVDSYAEYLLAGRSGCPVELSTDEVIMNSAVVAAADVETNLQIVVQQDPGITNPGTGNIVHLDEIPKTIQFQVLGDIPNYQYAVDALVNELDLGNADGGKAHFPTGACEGLRVTGKNQDIISVEIRGNEAKLVAGWATDHEAVKLTEAITFMLQEEGGGTGVAVPQEEKVDAPVTLEQSEPMTDKKAPLQSGETSWFDHLLSNEGCVQTDLSDERLTMLHDRPIVQFHQHLIVDGVAGSLPAEVSLELSPTTETVLMVVLESSDGASFENGACEGQRVAIHPGMTWPKLTIHKDANIFVHAVYEVPDDTSLRRIDRLELAWTPPDEKNLAVPIQEEHERIKDPQNVVDDTRRKTADAFKNHVKQVHEGLHALDEHDGPAEIKQKRDQRLQGRDSQGGVDQGQKKIELEAIRKDLLAHRKEALSDVDPDRQRAMIDKMKNHRNYPKKPGHESEDVGSQTGSVNQDLNFDLHGYYAGIGIFLVAHAVAIQVCLFASRRGTKGRRDL